MNAFMANNTKDKVRQLQGKLYLAAKGNSKRKFHALYDKVYRMDILEEAWKRVKTNGGVGGIDGISIEDIEADGAEKLLQEIGEELKAGRYRPSPVKRKFIPKGDGKMRPLGIPIIKDRIVQMAAKLVLEPIYEADFKDNSYGYRPKRSAQQALEVVRETSGKDGCWVVDADIKGYFDTINHDKLLKLVAMRLSDRRMLKLLRQWLKAGVMTEEGYEESEIGSPQGGVISPLLANIYLHYLDVVWERHGQHLGKLVRYADDLVIVCRTKRNADQALNLVREVMVRLELELHPEKTRVVQMGRGLGGFDFLGMHHKYLPRETSKGEWYYPLHQYPTNKVMKKMQAKVKEVLGSRSILKKDIGELVKVLNRKIIGWRNYYGVKTARQWLVRVDCYITERFTIWYNKKRQRTRHRSNQRKVLDLLRDLKLQKLA